ncbi:DUF669 domain-containing protein [Oenococcus sicerae]|uniref:DUF669 domain-containing protein n=1 Tax=Oenococcus sicerae TaxID=2203724 RepID=UPI0039ECEE42
MAFIYDSENTGNDNTFLDESGTYNVAVSNHKVSQTSTGKDMLTVDYTVLDGDHKGQTVNYDNYVDGEKSKWRINRLIKKAYGDKAPNGYKFNSLDQIGQGVTGKAISIKVEWERQEQGKHAGDYYLVVKSIDEKLPASMPDGKKRPGTENRTYVTTPTQTAANDMQYSKVQPLNQAANQVMDISDDDLPF